MAERRPLTDEERLGSAADAAPTNGGTPAPCRECEELHGDLIDAGRALVVTGVGLTAAILALGLILYLRRS